ncbi:gluconokinase [Staphylococcus condimenti]|uniref:Gluconokinase n=1 Tax=Staphylococcus condimenti TaxID=70255 RepID=A0A143PDH0_9STAP|nr:MULTISPECIES: gluconokinase [Staphylococcus]AMY06313.1 gluconate kinase [Staphylococcus condimenti]APR60196.1 gluconokinase [Staphylococcus condimenti]MDK8644350.1 gluconokinase [Staphylococcus condimenti]OFP00157.1 gluconate kinase [Staphylococcus sp. HMSC065E08]PNZ60465.1 gluconokinase [Staphylococcus condimenti]
MKYMIGVDVGTTSTKSVLYDENGNFLRKHNIGYDMNTPDVDTSEENPDEIFDAVLMTIKAVIREERVAADDIKLISFSAQMHSLIAMDNEQNPITESITWADNRASRYADIIRDEHQGHEIYKRTGTPIHPMSPLSKIFWMKHEKPEVYSNAKKYIDIKGYILYQLYGKYVMDYSIGSATGMMNLESLSWDNDVLKLLGITKEQLPELVPTTHIMTGMKHRYSNLLGINPDTPIIVGASDGVLSNLGVNSYKKGEVAVTIGTSGAIRTVIDHPRTDEKGRIFCYVLTEDQYVIGGPVNNGGIILRWLRDELLASEVETAKRLGVDPYDVLTKIASRVEPGSKGLIFHPYLAGERAPLWNANARGSYFGLTLAHKKEHMIRAALEGVLYNLYTVYLALIEVMGETPTAIKATGGFAKSEVWRQMMADIFATDVIVPESYESSCLGACVLGLKALGEIDDFSIIEEMVGTTHAHEPNQKAVEMYQQLISIFIDLSRSLESQYAKIADFQRHHL